MLRLHNDCMLYVILLLDYKSILWLGRVSKHFNALTRTPAIWLCKLHERMGREYISAEDPIQLFRRSLQAGYLKETAYIDDVFAEWRVIPQEWGQRNDIIRAHYGDSDMCHYLACVTLDNRCLVHLNYDHRITATGDIGEADDVLVHGDENEDNLDHARWFVVLLRNGRVRVLWFYYTDLAHAVELPMLPDTKVKSLLHIVDTRTQHWDYKNNKRITYERSVCNVVCLLEDNSVVSATCSFPSIATTLACNAGNCYAISSDRLCIADTPGTKYVRDSGSIYSGYIDIRAYLSNKKLVVRKYGYGFDTQCVGEEIILHFPGARVVGKNENHPKKTPVFIAHIEKEDVDDVWIIEDNIVVILAQGCMFYNTNDMHEWKETAKNVLWVRTTNSSSSICYISGTS